MHVERRKVARPKAFPTGLVMGGCGWAEFEVSSAEFSSRSKFFPRRSPSLCFRDGCVWLFHDAGECMFAFNFARSV